MAVKDWSTNPDLNTTVGGVFIGENCPPSNLNNGERQIMADARTKFDDVDEQLADLAGGSVAAIAALKPAANRIPYFTGPTTADQLPVSLLAKQLLAAETPDQARSLTQAVGFGSYVADFNGVVPFNIGGAQLTLQWGTVNGSFGEGAVAIPFNTPFSIACFIAVPWPIIGSVSNAVDFGCQGIGTPATNAFQVMVQKFGSSGSAIPAIGWLAVGR